MSKTLDRLLQSELWRDGQYHSINEYAEATGCADVTLRGEFSLLVSDGMALRTEDYHGRFARRFKHPSVHNRRLADSSFLRENNDRDC